MAVVLQDRTKQRDNDETLRLAKEQAEAAAFVESHLRGEIEAANIDLVAANRGLQQFTSIVAHDLRAPLKRIDAFMIALREDYTDRLDDEGKEMMTRVSRGAARMELMLDSLLDYSRYNADAIGGKSADLAHIVKGVIESCDFDTVESKININVADAPRVKGDPLLLAHVFQNLIGNAIKFRRGEQVCTHLCDAAAGGGRTADGTGFGYAAISVDTAPATEHARYRPGRDSRASPARGDRPQSPRQIQSQGTVNVN